MGRTVQVTFPPLYPKQYEAIFSPARYSLTEAGTKTGKTLGCAIWMVSEAWANDTHDDVSWWVAPIYAQAELGFNRMKSLLPPDLIKTSDSRLSIVLPTGASIFCKSGEKSDNLFGAAVKRAVVDEASRLREESWFALRTTLTQKRGRVRFIGNPKGKRNWFWRWCQLAKAGQDPEAAYFHLRTLDNPHVSREEVERARLELPPSVFEELYEGLAQEDGAGVFRNIRACVGECLMSPRTGRVYLAGLDLARLQDYTVLTIMDAVTRQVVHIERFNELSWNLQVERVKTAVKRYNDAMVMFDATGIGDPIYDQLVTAGVRVQPYRLYGEAKNQLIEALSIVFEQKRIVIPPDRQLIHELESYEYELTDQGRVKYHAPEGVGMHDDMVISLALVNLLCERSGYLEPTERSFSTALLQDYNIQVVPSGIEYAVQQDLQRFLARRHESRQLVEVE